MKSLRLLALLLLCTVLGGCVKYRVSLDNGSHFTVLGKPKLDKERNTYRYKAGGKEREIPAERVTSIDRDWGSDDWEEPGSGGSGDSFYGDRK